MTRTAFTLYDSIFRMSMETKKEQPMMSIAGTITLMMDMKIFILSLPFLFFETIGID